MVARFLETSCNVTEALCCAGLGWVDCAESAQLLLLLC